MIEGEVAIRDGVALVGRGDVISGVYQSAATLPRTRWLFDQVDAFAAKRPNGFMSLLIILPTADPPDAATRKENLERLRRYGRGLRRMVTVCVGDTFRIQVARTIMRGLSIMQGSARPTFVVENVDLGLARLLEGAADETPTADRLLQDLAAACRALGVEPRDASIRRPPPAAPPRGRSTSAERAG